MGMHIRLGLLSLALSLAVASGLSPVRADEIEKPTVAKLPPANGHRVYIGDFSTAHGVDSKIHVIDGDSLKLLANFTNGSFGAYLVAGDGKTVYSATSFFSRGDHGVRTEVLELYDTATMNPTGEVILSPKRAQTIGYPAFLQESAGGTYVFVQNATPASSVSVVDIAKKTLLTEIPTAGCFGIYPSSKVAGRFSSLCGDGSAVTVTFDETGKEISRKRSEKFFDPDKDALFITGLAAGDKTLFISFLGNVYPVDMSGETAMADKPWPIVTGKDLAANWRPGGYQLAAYAPETGMLYVCMHPNGKEGSHKQVAKEIWKIDTAKQKILGKVAAEGANYLIVSHEEHPLLFAFDQKNSTVVKFDGDKLKKLGATPEHWVIEDGGVMAIQ